MKKNIFVDEIQNLSMNAKKLSMKKNTHGNFFHRQFYNFFFIDKKLSMKYVTTVLRQQLAHAGRILKDSRTIFVAYRESSSSPQIRVKIKRPPLQLMRPTPLFIIRIDPVFQNCTNVRVRTMFDTLSLRIGVEILTSESDIIWN